MTRTDLNLISKYLRIALIFVASTLTTAGVYTTVRSTNNGLCQLGNNYFFVLSYFFSYAVFFASLIFGIIVFWNYKKRLTVLKSIAFGTISFLLLNVVYWMFPILLSVFTDYICK